MMTRSTSTICLLAASAVSLVACSEPGTLVIQLSGLPAATAATSVSITGTVSRVPAKETEIVIASSGGAAPASDTASADGTFTVRVELVTNAVNTITLTAQDGTGSVSAPVSVTIRQDAEPPSIATFTPTGANVSTAPSVSVTFTEPVVLDGADAVQLGNQLHAVPVSPLLSGDSLTVELALGEVLFENAVYGLSFPGVTDAAGNALAASGGACFVTANTAPAAAQETDPTNDLFSLGTPAGTSPADVDQVRLSIHTDWLFGVLRFTTDRSWGYNDSVNNAFAYIDLDLDQDPNTGYVTLKDTVFADDPSLASGIRVEYVIAVDWFPSAGDSALVGPYIDAGTFQTSFRFLPDVCGRHIGFAVPMTALNSDDGDFDYVIFAGTWEPTGDVVIDPVPEAGHHSVAFAGLFAPPIAVPGAAAMVQGAGALAQWLRFPPPR